MNIDIRKYVRVVSVVLIRFIWRSNHCYWERNVIYKYFASNLTNTSNFHSLEVVGRDSETLLEVGENFKYLI